MCNSFVDGGRAVSNIDSRFSAALIRSKVEGGSFSKWSSRLSAGRIRLNNLQQLQEAGSCSTCVCPLSAAQSRIE
eukprot:5975830-Pyramimonas_sp.AAC.1